MSKRIYHHYEMWEDYKFGFYNNCSGFEKETKTKSVINLFNCKTTTEKYMRRVINEWKYSCEHNLTNPSMNKIAYLGQSACCLYDNIPNTVTMIAWSLLTDEVRERSNKIAIKLLKEWEDNNKQIQTCLNIF